jgi:hypothetical protein
MRLLFVFIVSFAALSAFSQTPEELADLQLKGYNEGNIDMFMEPYSDSVKVFNKEGKMMYQGADIMRQNYDAMFKRYPKLYCNLLNRIAIGNTVIEHEDVSLGDPNASRIKAIVMYKVAKGKIQEVHFLESVQ